MIKFFCDERHYGADGSQEGLHNEKESLFIGLDGLGIVFIHVFGEFEVKIAKFIKELIQVLSGMAKIVLGEVLVHSFDG